MRKEWDDGLEKLGVDEDPATNDLPGMELQTAALQFPDETLLDGLLAAVQAQVFLGRTGADGMRRAQ